MGERNGPRIIHPGGGSSVADWERQPTELVVIRKKTHKSTNIFRKSKRRRIYQKNRIICNETLTRLDTHPAGLSDGVTIPPLPVRLLPSLPCKATLPAGREGRVSPWAFQGYSFLSPIRCQRKVRSQECRDRQEPLLQSLHESSGIDADAKPKTGTPPFPRAV